MIDVIKQLFRFGMIGVLAAAVHMGVVVFVVQNYALTPLTANIIGFIISFHVSYWGHRNYTFYDSVVIHRVALPKLLVVQTICFMMNEFLYYCLLSWQLPYALALFIVLAIMPIFAFILSKIWVF